jgi:hypothetical protein
MGFRVHRGVVDGVALCRMFNHETCAQSPAGLTPTQFEIYTLSV